MERFYERRPEIRLDRSKEIINSIEPIFERFLLKNEKNNNELSFENLSVHSKERNLNNSRGSKTLYLEEGRRNRRIDEFIADRMRDPFPRVEPDAQRVVPDIQRAEPQVVRSTRTNFVSPTGFKAIAHDFDFPEPITVRGQRVMSQDGKYTEIHFTPGRRSFFDPTRMTDSLAKGIQGVVELLEAVGQGKFEPAQLLVGVTNINMALIAQRLGFTIVDECRTPDGEIDRKLTSFTVVGKLDEIRARVEEFKRKGTAEKLSQRSQRLQAKVIPQAAR